MADYIYLLETRLSPAQREALNTVRDVARTHGITVFLVGGAVRDLTSGTSIRDLDVVVQGNALKLKKELEKAGAVVVGSHDPFQSLYLTFPGGVRVQVGSTLTVEYPKPGKAVAKPAAILDDLRRRDFTANAMAVSLNEGSFGLLMDPLNGVADIENRELRLVSNYGFIEEPSRMIRAVRLGARLGWVMEERTQQRYDTGKSENYIEAMAPWEHSYELEEIFHEEDPLRIARKLEAEGWSKVLFPSWSPAKANETEVERLRDAAGQLNTMGIYPDISAAMFPLLTAKLGGKESASLKQALANPGFVAEIESLEGRTKALAAQLTSKAAAAPSEAWKLLYAADPQALLSLVFSSKSTAIQQKLKLFFNEWPQARTKIPYTLMQEMRITPDLPGYDELVGKLFFAIMDAKLETPEQTKAFLEPYSPPAPPPPPNLRRRPAKRESKASKKAAKRAEATAVPAGEAGAVAAESGAAPVAAATPNGSKPNGTKPGGTKPASAAKKTATAVSAPATEDGAAGNKSSAKAATKVPAKAPAKAAPVTVAAKKAPAKKPAKPVQAVAKKATKAPAKKVPPKPAPRKPVKAAAKRPINPAKSPAKRPAKASAKKSTPAKKAVGKKAARKH